MNSSFWFDTIKLGQSIVYMEVSQILNIEGSRLYINIYCIMLVNTEIKYCLN